MHKRFVGKHYGQGHLKRLRSKW